jgi:hypothetical protein
LAVRHSSLEQEGSRWISPYDNRQSSSKATEHIEGAEGDYEKDKSSKKKKLQKKESSGTKLQAPWPPHDTKDCKVLKARDRWRVHSKERIPQVQEQDLASRKDQLRNQEGFPCFQQRP